MTKAQKIFFKYAQTAPLKTIIKATTKVVQKGVGTVPPKGIKSVGFKGKHLPNKNAFEGADKIGKGAPRP